MDNDIQEEKPIYFAETRSENAELIDFGGFAVWVEPSPAPKALEA